MEKEEAIPKIREFLKEHPFVNIPVLSRLLDIPTSRSRVLLYELEVDGLLYCERVKVNKNTARFWKLKEKEKEKEMDNGQGTSKLNAT